MKIKKQTDLHGNRIGDVIVSMLTSNVGDCGFKPTQRL